MLYTNVCAVSYILQNEECLCDKKSRIMANIAVKVTILMRTVKMIHQYVRMNSQATYNEHYT